MSKQHYMVAVDGSEWGVRAADRAISLAKQTGASVRLVSVIPWSGFQPMTLDEVAHRPMDKAEEEKTVRAEVLEPILTKHADSGVDISADFYWGHPVEVIHKQAKKDHTHMIFAGRRGRSRVADLLLGSVSNSLAHKAGVPVVLVP